MSASLPRLNAFRSRAGHVVGNVAIAVDVDAASALNGIVER
jgi:hypothetical protein